MDRRSFFLTSLLPIFAAKRGVLGLHHPVFRRELCKDRILIMKARSIGMSQLVHAKCPWLNTSTFWSNGYTS